MSKLPRNQQVVELQEWLESMSANVLRLTEEKEQDAATIEYWKGRDEHNADRIAALQSLLADVTERMNIAVNLGRLVKVQADEWQEMAEDLWEELQEWHGPHCPRQSDGGGAPLRDCVCHRILAAKWDQIANAGDWAHGPEDEP